MPLPVFVRAAGRTYRYSAPEGRHVPARRLAAIALLASAVGALAWTSIWTPAWAQTIDCGQLRAQIAQAGRGGGGRAAGAARRQASELARTQAYAQQLGCGGFSFFGGDPRCGGLQQRIQQMQANLSQLQAGGGGARGDLVARFNAYCRGGQPQPQQPRGFFESLFGGAQEEPRPVAPVPDVPGPDDMRPSDDDGTRAHGGSQAVCVRTCDGGFFPLGVSARRGQEDLADMCHTLCPGTETAVFTRNPNSEIDTAVGLDGKPYADLPNAMKFSKAFTPACSCLPAGKSWAQVLANADETIGDQHRGDILVTPEKSAELSRPKLDPKTRTSLLQPPPATVTPEDAAKIAGDAVAGDAAPPRTVEVTGPDGLKRTVRQVGPKQ